MKKQLLIALCAGILPVAANAQLLNEFEPNPGGQDPAMQDVELSGTPGAAFDLWILSIENDGFNGFVDRASNVAGSYDANGLAVVTIGDLENPSNTVILTDSFTGTTATDIDPNNDGMLDLSTIGTIFDAVGISDNVNDDASLYAESLGGTNILFNGQFEPLTVFREATTGEWFNTVTIDFGQPSERVGVFNATGSEVDASIFATSPLGTSFGAANPAFVPEPTAAALALLGVAAIARRR